MMDREISPIWTRKRDLLYLSFFLVHIPIMLGISLPILAIKPFPCLGRRRFFGFWQDCIDLADTLQLNV